MTPKERARKAINDFLDMSPVKIDERGDRVIPASCAITIASDCIFEAEREAIQKTIDFIRQELRLIEMPYVAAYERGIYNEALCETCRAVDDLTPENILDEEWFFKKHCK